MCPKVFQVNKQNELEDILGHSIYLNKKLTDYNGASLSRKTLFLYSSFDCMIILGIFHSQFIYDPGNSGGSLTEGGH